MIRTIKIWLELLTKMSAPFNFVRRTLNFKFLSVCISILFILSSNLSCLPSNADLNSRYANPVHTKEIITDYPDILTDLVHFSDIVSLSSDNEPPGTILANEIKDIGDTDDTGDIGDEQNDDAAIDNDDTAGADVIEIIGAAQFTANPVAAIDDAATDSEDGGNDNPNSGQGNNQGSENGNSNPGQGNSQSNQNSNSNSGRGNNQRNENGQSNSGQGNGQDNQNE